MADLPDDPIEVARRRKLANKRFNERIKLGATALNAIAIATFGAAVVLPGVTGNPVPSQWIWIWISIAAGLHFIAHVVIGLLRSED